jgi:hypothetical protein
MWFVRGPYKGSDAVCRGPVYGPLFHHRHIHLRSQDVLLTGRTNTGFFISHLFQLLLINLIGYFFGSFTLIGSSFDCLTLTVPPLVFTLTSASFFLFPLVGFSLSFLKPDWFLL